MKRILISLSIIGVAAAIAIGATTAYFSDTEQSSNNTFTAGKLDLIFRDVSNPLVEPVIINSSALFTLLDMKPGDTDEKTVDLIVDNNPACGKLTINVTDDFDNTCTEPEIGNESSCATSPTGIEAGSGELNDAVNFRIWKDNGASTNACNNVLDTDETTLISGPLTGSMVYSIGELPIIPGDEACYGIAYCFGDWIGAACSGVSVNNASQTDSFKAALIIDAFQKRNQFPDNPATTSIIEGCPLPGVWL